MALHSTASNVTADLTANAERDGSGVDQTARDAATAAQATADAALPKAGGTITGNLTIGDAATDEVTLTAVVAGDITLKHGGVGAPRNLTVATSTTPGTQGRGLQASGGSGAAGSGATPGGDGAATTFKAGDGGAGTGTAAAGGGATVTVAGGNAGTNAGGGGGVGGGVTIRGGLPTGSGAYAPVLIGSLWTRAVSLGNSNTPTGVLGELFARVFSPTDNPYTVAAGDFILNIDTSGAARGVTLPTATLSLNPTDFANGGRLLVVTDYNGNAAANNITITAPIGDTINGAGTYVISANHGSVVLIPSSATSWMAIAKF